MIDTTQAHVEWQAIEDAQNAVRDALAALALAQYRHNLTRGCDPVSAHRVTHRDFMDSVQPAIDAAHIATLAAVVQSGYLH